MEGGVRAGEGGGSKAGCGAVAQSLQAENCCCLPLCSQHTKDSMCMALGFFRGAKGEYTSDSLGELPFNYLCHLPELY